MDPLGIEGAWIFNPRIHLDNRGNFHEWFRLAGLPGDPERGFTVAQANCSVSRRGVIRGVHFSEVPPGQAKYVVCASGAIIDVVVDIRVGSPTYGSWEAVELDDQKRRAIYITEGLGHAFTAVSQEATVMYLCSTGYAPEQEHQVHALDPDLAIAWPKDVEPILSAKDATAPTLAQARQAGLLPAYDDCLALRQEPRPRP